MPTLKVGKMLKNTSFQPNSESSRVGGQILLSNDLANYFHSTAWSGQLPPLHCLDPPPRATGLPSVSPLPLPLPLLLREGN